MRYKSILLAALLLTPGWIFAVDFTRFSDMCDPTPTQSCPNKTAEVKALQKALNADPSLYLYIRENGQWNKGTKEAVIVFQEHYNIRPANGYVGRKSRAVLQKITHGAAPAVAAPTVNKKVEKKHTPKLPDVPPTREFVLYSDMCDNSIKGNHCPNKVIEVSNLQILLNADPNLNVNIAADGKWGKGTQDAVIAFQKYYNIVPASGYIGRKSKKILDRVAGAMVAQAARPVSHKKHSANTTGKATAIASWKDICETTETDTCPNRPEDVKALQTLLNKTLHLKLTVDGKWGKGTQRAVIVFQKMHKISPASGYVGRRTRRVLQKAAK